MAVYSNSHSKEQTLGDGEVENKVVTNVDVSETELGIRDGDGLDELDAADQKALTRRFDCFLIPILGLLYLLSFLDRGNIGNANVADPSISKTLHLTPKEFGAAVSVVYATYVVFEPIWANLFKIIGPRLMLSVSCLTWGAITMGTAWAKEYTHLIAIRVLLGVFEAGLFPCISVYVFMTYRREEVGRRMSYIFACSALAGAFGGLIAYGLIQIDSGSLVGWQYLYIIEGILSIAAAPLTFFWIPNSIEQAWFLSPKQKQLTIKRIEQNKAFYNPDEPFSWREVAKGALDWKTWTTGAIQFCADITLYGLSTFMPAIIRGMGYSNVNAQLLTVPVYVLAAVVFLIVGRLSDRFQVRSPFLAGAFVCIIVGYGIQIGVDHVGGRYAGLFITAMGMYVVPGLNVSWISNNTAGHYKRTTAFGLNQLVGNCAGAAIGSIFSAAYKPRYFTSLHIAIGLSGLGLVLVVGKALILMRINKNREKLIAEGAEDLPELGDKNPHFRYFL